MVPVTNTHAASEKVDIDNIQGNEGGGVPIKYYIIKG